MVALTGQMGVPVIVVDGQPVIGFDRARLQQLLASSSSSPRPRLGLKVTDASSLPRRPGEPPLFGALVGAVAPASSGQRAGLKSGDIITGINQKRIDNIAELEEALGAFSSGGRIPVTYYRGEKAIKSEIIIS